jgi:glycosyltransferase involved in cell wall biosynthesis
MRIAFHHYASDWDAEGVFLEGMFIALRALGAECPTLVLVVDDHAVEADYPHLAARPDEVLPAPMHVVDQWMRIQWSVRFHTAWWLRHRVLKMPVRAAPHPLTDFLPSHQIDAYFTRACMEASVQSVPSLVWIPDFQHLRLPDLFPPEDRAGRDAVFGAQARAATRLLVTSEDVRRDLQAFAPQQAAKVRCLQYVAHVPTEAYRADPRDGLARYHLPEKFIYLPNQFWQHKNHLLVFEALARLRARGVYPTIVSTGNPVDYRRPAYFSELMQTLSQANLREQFILLGQVPRDDVFRLMRQSVCVLNPSRFEGLGMSVAESKSLGKHVLASDLGPLREQAAPGAVYFNPADAGDLAEKLEAAWSTIPPGPDRALESAARAELPRRQAAFGRALLDLFLEAQADFNSA